MAEVAKKSAFASQGAEPGSPATPQATCRPPSFHDEATSALQTESLGIMHVIRDDAEDE